MKSLKDGRNLYAEIPMEEGAQNINEILTFIVGSLGSSTKAQVISRPFVFVQNNGGLISIQILADTAKS